MYDLTFSIYLEQMFVMVSKNRENVAVQLHINIKLKSANQ